ncbi:MAG: Na+/H+ antiporter NhaC family protein [Planctomycetota bacterium]|jgi:Na+/H+ antiporter NhaC
MTKAVTRVAVALVIFGVLCTLAALFAPPGTEDPHAAMWYSVIPPVLAIVLAFLTRHVLLSLGIAILMGGLLTAIPQAPVDVAAWFEGFKTAGIYMTDTVKNKTNLQILAFIPPIFVMIEVLIASGGFRGIIVWLLKWVKGRKSAQAATALMGILCFIDDYTNAIVVGSMMQPITDRFRVSREKLAFLVDATSAPIAGLAVVSTWIAYEVGLLRQIGEKLDIGKSGYSMFFDALSFRFYCLLMIVFVFVHILMGRDFGPMKEAEERAKTKDPPEEDGIQNTQARPERSRRDTRQNSKHTSGRAINALVPLAGLLIFHGTGLWFDGTSKLKDDMLQWQTQSLTTAAENMPPKPVDIEALSPGSWIYWREVIGHAENSPLVLACAALFGLTLALLFAQMFGSLRWPVIIDCFKRGVRRAMIPFVILIFAWSLKNCCDDLKTGEFLTTILAGRVPPYLFPPILFLVASLTSFATGTSYGTMAILIPTAIPIAFAIDDGYGLTTMISLGAVLDGAIFGDHCSPISDTTIMSSIASSCDLIEHVRTQLPYSLFVAGLALLCAYVPSALGLAPRYSLLLATAVMLCFFVAISRLKKA